MATFFARSAVLKSLRLNLKPVHQLPTPVIFLQVHVQAASTTLLRDFSSFNSSPAQTYCSALHRPRAALFHAEKYAIRCLTTKQPNQKLRNDDDTEDKHPQPIQVKLSLFQRFKQMYRDYWYVLVPVHLITSAGWLGSFYYMAKSGIDVVAIMESYNISERITSPLKDSSLGYLAISYAMYKIATPIRYTVTLGGTTISINYLKKWGYIKPVPTREQLKEIYKEKKENIIDTMKDKRDELRLKKEQFKDRTDNLIDDMEKKIITKINDTKKKTTTTTSTIEKP